MIFSVDVLLWKKNCFSAAVYFKGTFFLKGAAVLAIALGLAACNQPSGGDSNNDSEKKTEIKVGTVGSIEMKENRTYNNQAVVEWIASDNEYAVKTGDKLSFTIKGTPDGNVSEVKAFVVDNSEAANYWKLLSGYVNTGAALTKDTEAAITFDVEITADASSAAPEACKLALYFEPVQKDTITINVSEFKVEKK